MVTGRSAQSKRRGRETRSGLATFASFGGVAHRVDERDGRAAAAQRRVVRRGRDVRVAGDVHRRARLGEDVEPADVVLGVHLHDLLARRGGEGVEADELARARFRGEVGGGEGVEDGGDAEVGLRVPLARVLHRGRRRVDELGGEKARVVQTIGR